MGCWSSTGTTRLFYDSIHDVKLNTEKNKNLCTFYEHNAGQDCVLRITNWVFENIR
jgi:hypothetical protein